MNNPYPTHARLAHERRADKLLEAQEADTKAYAALVAEFIAKFDRLSFPLASPSMHYGVEEITAFLTDSLKPRDVADLEETAMSITMESV